MADFPKERLTADYHLFCNTTVHYFNPLEIALSRNGTDKRYGPLFTCLTKWRIEGKNENGMNKMRMKK